MDLKRLRYAIALADELNFVRAAEKLHLSQPALSRGIQVLEDELGLILFDRGNRAVTVTKAGERFLEHARRVVYQMRTFELDMEQLRGGGIGHVAFGVGPTPAYGLMSPVLRRLRQQQPDLRFTIDSNNARYLLLHLRSEAIEFFVADTRELAQEPDLTAVPLCRQHGTFICRRGHPLLEKRDLQMRDMLEYGFALGTWSGVMLAALQSMLGMPSGEPLPVVLESDNITLLKNLVMQDDVIMAVTRATVAGELAAGTLCVLQLPQASALYAEIGVVYLKGRTLSPAAEVVLQVIREAAVGAPDTAAAPMARAAEGVVIRDRAAPVNIGALHEVRHE